MAKELLASCRDGSSIILDPRTKYLFWEDHMRE